MLAREKFGKLKNLTKFTRFNKDIGTIGGAYTAFQRFVIVSSILADLFGTKQSFYKGVKLAAAFVAIKTLLIMGRDNARKWDIDREAIKVAKDAIETCNRIEKVASAIIVMAGLVLLCRGKPSLYGISQIAFNAHNLLN